MPRGLHAATCRPRRSSETELRASWCAVVLAARASCEQAGAGLARSARVRIGCLKPRALRGELPCTSVPATARATETAEIGSCRAPHPLAGKSEGTTQSGSSAALHGSRAPASVSPPEFRNDAAVAIFICFLARQPCCGSPCGLCVGLGMADAPFTPMSSRARPGARGARRFSSPFAPASSVAQKDHAEMVFGVTPIKAAPVRHGRPRDRAARARRGG